VLNRRAHWPLTAGIAGALVLAVAACGASEVAAHRVVPNVVGKRVAVAEAALAADGFVVSGVGVSSVSPFAPGTLAARIARGFLSPNQVHRLVVCGTRPPVGHAAVRYVPHRGSVRYFVSLAARRSCNTS
jgi:hypothetical protein